MFQDEIHSLYRKGKWFSRRFEKGTKMLNRYVIRVCTETKVDGKVIENKAGYFSEFACNKYLRTQDVVTKTFATREEAIAVMETLPTIRVSKLSGGQEFVETYSKSTDVVKFSHANNLGWTDVNPFEIVRVVSPKTIEIRMMDSEELPWDRDFHSGGFFGHTSNQNDQKWKITSNPNNPVMKARLRKDGYFHSDHGRHSLSNEPRKFYDYNF